MNASHTSLKQVPAHRVVNRNGVLSGKNFFSTPFEMQEKLELDGLKIVDDKIIDFKSIYWDPQLELTI
jgi:methylated-DNA-protein-cysteine methyltransferase-like protein